MRLGILGGGQLARMIAIAARPLGATCTVVDPAPSPPAASVARHLRAAYDDAAALAELRASSDVVTYEFENVPAHAAETPGLLEEGPRRALLVAQDRLREKELFRSLSIPTPEFAAVDDRASFDTAVARIGYPCVLKTRRLGYDGKGQCVLRGPGDLPTAAELIATAPCILEAYVRFTSECSVLVVADRAGHTRTYPLIANEHRGGILRRSTSPADGVPTQVHDLAVHHATSIVKTLSYVGVLALELFRVGDVLLANEIAPRVHNSGHLTIEGSETSQFENHARAVLGLPLGSTRARGPAVMLNCIGGEPSLAALLATNGVHVHRYEKAPAPGRKVAHVTITGDSVAEIAERVAAVAPLVEAASA